MLVCMRVVWKVRRNLFARVVLKVPRMNFVVTNFYELSEQPSYIIASMIPINRSNAAKSEKGRQVTMPVCTKVVW